MKALPTGTGGARPNCREREEKVSLHNKPDDLLKALWDAWFQLLEDEEFPGGCIVTSVAGEYRARPGAIQALVTEYREIWRQALLSATMQAKGEGALAPNADPQQIVFEIVAFQEAAHVRIADRLRAQRAVNALIDRIQRGS